MTLEIKLICGLHRLENGQWLDVRRVANVIFIQWGSGKAKYHGWAKVGALIDKDGSPRHTWFERDENTDCPRPEEAEILEFLDLAQTLVLQRMVLHRLLWGKVFGWALFLVLWLLAISFVLRYL